MKTCLMLIMTVVLIFSAACSKNPVEEYGDTLKKAKDRSKATAVKAELQFYNQAAESYRAVNGKNAATIEELESFMGKTIDKNVYGYNPETGAVSQK